MKIRQITGHYLPNILKLSSMHGCLVPEFEVTGLLCKTIWFRDP
jgi:hypothetical protein